MTTTRSDRVIRIISVGLAGLAFGIGFYVLPIDALGTVTFLPNHKCDQSTCVNGCNGLNSYNCTGSTYNCPPIAKSKLGWAFRHCDCVAPSAAGCNENNAIVCFQDEYYGAPGCTVHYCNFQYTTTGC